MSELALPRPGPRLPAEFIADLEAQVAQIEDIATLNEGRRRIAALATYLSSKAERDEARWGERITERRIGELLPEAESGSHTSALLTPGCKDGLTHHERYWFRKLAEHWRIAIAMRAGEIAIDRHKKPKPIVGRKPIIDEILRRTRPQQPPDEVEGVEIRHGAAADLEIAPASAALILTDPPYGVDYLQCWEDLADLAAAALRSGGILAAYSGQHTLPAAFAALEGRDDLEYLWTAAVVHDGSFFQYRKHKIQVGWKPVLIYAAPPARIGGWWSDTLTDGRREKDYHGWGQAEAEAAQLIEAHTLPGDLVVDPFLGGGTTPAVAARLGRRFLGCDDDEVAVATAQDRVAQ